MYSNVACNPCNVFFCTICIANSIFSMNVQPAKRLSKKEIEFIGAAKDGKYEKVKLFINGVVDVNAHDPLHIPALHEAASYGHLEIMKVLIREGANPNIRANGFGDTPLHYAASNGHADCVRFLLEKGADGGRGNNLCIIPLHKAVMRARNEDVLLLLMGWADEKWTEEDRKAYVNSPDLGGRTPLHYASESSNEHLVELLCDNGANPNAQAAFDSSPLHFACSDEKFLPALLALLKRGAEVDAKDKDQRTPLHLAVREGSLKSVEHLLQKGANKDATDRWGRKPIMYATDADDEIKKLIDGWVPAEEIIGTQVAQGPPFK